MPFLSYKSPSIRAITSCVPQRVFDNLTGATAFPKADVDKIVRMAGVRNRHVAGERACSSDLCEMAARDVMASLNWQPESVDALVMVTQFQDYFPPSW